MDNEPVTKKDLQEVLEAVNHGFSEVQQEISEVRKEMTENKKEISEVKKEALENKKEILNSNEKIAKEINDMRQEQTIHQGGHIRTNDTLLEHGDQLKDHEKRITKLEPLPQGV